MQLRQAVVTRACAVAGDFAPKFPRACHERTLSARRVPRQAGCPRVWMRTTARRTRWIRPMRSRRYNSRRLQCSFCTHKSSRLAASSPHHMLVCPFRWHRRCFRRSACRPAASKRELYQAIWIGYHSARSAVPRTGNSCCGPAQSTLGSNQFQPPRTTTNEDRDR